MRLFLTTCLLLVTACALRPRYGDFITKNTPPGNVVFRIVDPMSHAAIVGAKVELSELRNKMVVTSDEQGQFSLPVDRKYLDENPVFVVALPKGLTEYRVELAPPAVAQPLEEVPEPKVDQPPAPIAADAGVLVGDPMRQNG